MGYEIERQRGIYAGYPTQKRLVSLEWCLACIGLNKRKNNPNREYLAGLMRERERSDK